MTTGDAYDLLCAAFTCGLCLGTLAAILLRSSGS